MGRPKKGYFTTDGERVPSVTTVLSRFKESGGLLHWAHKQGLQGNELYAERDAAAHCGTLAHNMVEAFINKQDHMQILKNEDQETAKKALNAFQMFREWFENTKIKIISHWQEIPIVCDELKFGGTPDAIGRDAYGNLILLDWKTSNGLYSDYLIQVSAYGYLWEKEFNEKITGYHICRFARETPDFHHHYFETVNYEFAYFKLLLECYRMDKRIKDRCK